MRVVHLLHRGGLAGLAVHGVGAVPHAVGVRVLLRVELAVLVRVGLGVGLEEQRRRAGARVELEVVVRLVQQRGETAGLGHVVTLGQGEPLGHVRVVAQVQVHRFAEVRAVRVDVEQIHGVVVAIAVAMPRADVLDVDRGVEAHGDGREGAETVQPVGLGAHRALQQRWAQEAQVQAAPRGARRVRARGQIVGEGDLGQRARIQVEDDLGAALALRALEALGGHLAGALHLREGQGGQGGHGEGTELAILGGHQRPPPRTASSESFNCTKCTVPSSASGPFNTSPGSSTP
jgi:hypothetical protein